MCESKGTIQRGFFFEGVGLQRYAPGQDCKWKIQVDGAQAIKLYFEEVALGWDDLDYVTVAGHDGVVKRKVTRFGKHVKIEVAGDEASIHFVTFGGRSPYPSSAGFILHYEAGKNSRPFDRNTAIFTQEFDVLDTEFVVNLIVARRILAASGESKRRDRLRPK